MSEEKRNRLRQDGLAYEFGHTLEEQIGGQIAAGFAIHGFYEDDWDDAATPLNKYASTYVATLAIKSAAD